MHACGPPAAQAPPRHSEHAPQVQKAWCCSLGLELLEFLLELRLLVDLGALLRGELSPARLELRDLLELLLQRLRLARPLLRLRPLPVSAVDRACASGQGGGAYSEAPAGLPAPCRSEELRLHRAVERLQEALQDGVETLLLFVRRQQLGDVDVLAAAAVRVQEGAVVEVVKVHGPQRLTQRRMQLHGGQQAALEAGESPRELGRRVRGGAQPLLRRHEEEEQKSGHLGPEGRPLHVRLEAGHPVADRRELHPSALWEQPLVGARGLGLPPQGPEEVLRQAGPLVVADRPLAALETCPGVRREAGQPLRFVQALLPGAEDDGVLTSVMARPGLQGVGHVLEVLPAGGQGGRLAERQALQPHRGHASQWLHQDGVQVEAGDHDPRELPREGRGRPEGPREPRGRRRPELHAHRVLRDLLMRPAVGVAAHALVPALLRDARQ
mmetsp:Transcript_88107/g.278679  ORF Transcript_88107/g.278679 Transcript_88107/m.278679 type:complete len:440 (-) Transcript_88107:876-2195(-)